MKVKADNLLAEMPPAGPFKELISSFKILKGQRILERMFKQSLGANEPSVPLEDGSNSRRP
jgi:hypothetical protein